MAERIVLEDIMLDSEPVGLAEEFVAVGSPITTVIGTDEEAQVGEIVYFGAELVAGEIGEVKGKVIECEQIGDLFAVTLEVLELDARFPELLAKALQGGQEESQNREGEPLWGIGLKQTNGAMAALVNCPAGLLTTEQLTKLAEIMSKGHGLAKLTHAQRIVLLLRLEQVETVRAELAGVGLRIGVLHTGVRNIRGCCGALCQFSQGVDGLGLALEVDRALYGRPMKFDVKIAVSDCLRNCMESLCVDIGLIARGNCYDVHVGGVASSVHLRGVKLVGGIKTEEAVGLISRILDWYDARANKGERFFKTLERVGTCERSLPEGNRFADTAKLFDEFGMQETIESYLNSSFLRGAAVMRMRADLGLPA